MASRSDLLDFALSRLQSAAGKKKKRKKDKDKQEIKSGKSSKIDVSLGDKGGSSDVDRDSIEGQPPLGKRSKVAVLPSPQFDGVANADAGDGNYRSHVYVPLPLDHADLLRFRDACLADIQRRWPELYPQLELLDDPLHCSLSRMLCLRFHEIR